MTGGTWVAQYLAVDPHIQRVAVGIGIIGVVLSVQLVWEAWRTLSVEQESWRPSAVKVLLARQQVWAQSTVLYCQLVTMVVSILTLTLPAVPVDEMPLHVVRVIALRGVTRTTVTVVLAWLAWRGHRTRQQVWEALDMQEQGR